MNKPKVEQVPLPSRVPRHPFNEMAIGDSFYFERQRPTDVASSFGTFLRKGRYRILREGNGYRFYLMK